MTHRPARPGRFRGCFVAMTVLAMAAGGCGRRGLPGTVPVEGTVTFGGGACPAVGYVYFLPVDVQGAAAAMQPRTGWARFEKDGRYRATTLVTYDGLLPGSYTVRVDCHATGAGSNRHEAGASHVPAATSLPPLVVPKGSRRPIRYDIDIGGRPGGAPVAPGSGG